MQMDQTRGMQADVLKKLGGDGLVKGRMTAQGASLCTCLQPRSIPPLIGADQQQAALRFRESTVLELLLVGMLLQTPSADVT